MSRSPATCWNVRRFISVIVVGRRTVRLSMRQCCRGVERMRAGSHAETFSWLAASYRSVGIRGPQGVSGARRGLRHDGDLCRNVKMGGKAIERVVGKAAGDECVFIPGRGPGLADEAVRRLRLTSAPTQVPRPKPQSYFRKSKRTSRASIPRACI
jgi:hypothetical protein